MSGTSRARAQQRPWCETCDHWDAQMAPDFTTAKGLCRLNAPLVTGGLYGPERTLWPTTDAADWCGQHSALSIEITGESLADPDWPGAAAISEHWRGVLRGEEPVRPVPIEPEGTLYDAHLADATEPHWHIVQNVAQRLGATRVPGQPGLWNVPSHARMGISARELLALGTPEESQVVESEVVHNSPIVQRAARRLGATPAGWPHNGGRRAATLWNIPGHGERKGTAELLNLATESGT